MTCRLIWVLPWLRVLLVVGCRGQAVQLRIAIPRPSSPGGAQARPGRRPGAVGWAAPDQSFVDRRSLGDAAPDIGRFVSDWSVAWSSFAASVSFSHEELSEPDSGTVNTHPRARPWQLPRTRRGRKRPASISVHGAASAASPAVEKCGLSGAVRSSGGSSLIAYSRGFFASLHQATAQLTEAESLPLPSLWRSACPCRPCRPPSACRSGGHTARRSFPRGPCPPGT